MQGTRLNPGNIDLVQLVTVQWSFNNTGSRTDWAELVQSFLQAHRQHRVVNTLPCEAARGWKVWIHKSIHAWLKNYGSPQMQNHKSASNLTLFVAVTIVRHFISLVKHNVSSGFTVMNNSSENWNSGVMPSRCNNS